MNALAQEVRPETAADWQAETNFRKNLAALKKFQPTLAASIPAGPENAEWLYARDGYLTARSDNRWFTGCSVPLLTGRQLLKKLELIGPLGCSLCPSHPGQLRACFEKIEPTQSIVAVIPDLQNLAMFLRCDDFAPELSGARLFFASGPDWSAMLAGLFEKYEGLALPQQFIRTALLDDELMAQLSSEAQTIISRETERRSTKIQEILLQPKARNTGGRTIVLASSRLNLSDLANLALRKALAANSEDPSMIAFDPEDPLTASPLALARAASQADILIAPDLFRSDLQGMVPPTTRWITWVTTGRIVPAASALSGDTIILADPNWRKSATDAGWKPSQIELAAWPPLLPPQEAVSGATVAILTDIRPIEMPQRVKDFSSQQLLWEAIEEELARDPLALGSDADRYLDRRMKRLNISPEGCDRQMFFDSLIEPAYKMGLARFVIKNGAPLRLIGRGWPDLVEFNSNAFGSAETLEDLVRALQDCRAIVHSFPRGNGYGNTLSIQEIQPAGKSSNDLLRRVRHAIQANKREQRDTTSPLTRASIRAFLTT